MNIITNMARRCRIRLIACALAQVVDGLITSLGEKLPEDFDNLDLKLRIGDNITPYLVVLLQERTRSFTH
jgi:hypothetical protein